MNRDEAWDLWLARLRDPASMQATGKLEDLDTGGMCCLGHACAVLDAKRIVEAGQVIYRVDSSASILYLPNPLAELLDVTTCVDFTSATDEHTSAMSLNDDGYSLREIADTLERKRGAGELKRYCDEADV